MKVSRLELILKPGLQFARKHNRTGKQNQKIYALPIFLWPTSGTVGTLETGRREVPGSNPGRAFRPSRSEFSVVFSETRVNKG